MSFNQLKAALRMEIAGQRAECTSRTLAKSISTPALRSTLARKVVSVCLREVAQPLLKALGDVPNNKIKEASIDSAALRGEVPSVKRELGAERRTYRVTHGQHSLTEVEARAACERGLHDGRISVDDAMRIEYCLNEHRAMPAALVANLFEQ